METLDVGLNVLLYSEMAMSFGEHEVEVYGLNLKSPPQAHVLNIYSLTGNLFSG